ncbi:MAG: hypothetical protein QGG64_08605 [Candidatus Latescibacteria bacterium]|nr:hypothetical protein [Candidatus Latescibacterota bacterium]
MRKLKIVLVGGGSFRWTPRLVCNILENESLNGSHVVLYDINSEALELTGKLSEKYRALYKSDTTFFHTADQAEALEGADAVVVTLSTGGLEAMQHDLEIPETFGIFHTVGDTVGPAGLSRSLRNIPIMLDLARAMETHCPNAWMLNCSNPLSALTHSVTSQTSIKAVGVCHGVVSAAKIYAKFFGTQINSCAWSHTGINHFSWFTQFSVEGRCAWDILAEKGLDTWLALSPEQAKEDPVFGPIYGFRCGLKLGRTSGAIPAIGDRHLAEFLPGYLTSEDRVASYGLMRTTIEGQRRQAAGNRARVERLVKGEEDLPPVASRDNVAAWIAGLFGGSPAQDNLNAPNTGQIPQLPGGVIVETRGLLDTAGIHPFVSQMPKAIEAIVRPQALREALTVEAALEGSFEKALSVIITDPLLPSVEIACPMLEALIASTRKWLPQF